MDLGSLLPPRSVEDILAERVRLSIGGEVYDLPTLVIAENEAWKSRLDSAMGALLDSAADADDPGSVLEALASDTGPFLDLLLSYDRTGVLPEREVIRSTWTELGLLCAVLEVWRAANPLVDIGIGVWSMTVRQVSASRLPTKVSQQSTDGAFASSAVS